MARLSYRNRIVFRKLFRVLLIVLAALVIFAFVALIYLEPYMVYDREGAHLELEEDPAQDVIQLETAPRPVITDPKIVYGSQAPVDTDLVDLTCYYITTDMLRDPAAVLQAVKELDGACAVMVQLKSSFGNFYYDTQIKGTSVADVDTAVVEELLKYMKNGNFYMIAEISSFPDTAFALSHQTAGLPLSSGALWMDDQGRYWLDATDPTTQSYLKQISEELAARGFREIAFSDFSVPVSENIVYGDTTPEAMLSDAVTQITEALTTETMTVSFVSDDLAFPISACTGRFYIPDVSGSQVEQYAQTFVGASNLREVVFIASSKDTRFDNKAVMRPLFAES